MRHALIATNRNYRLLLSASSVSNLGDGIAMGALPWLATTLTTDPRLIAAVATAQCLPWLLFALPAGVWADRTDRRLLMRRSGSRHSDGVHPCPCAFTSRLARARGFGARRHPVPELVNFLFGSAEVIRDNAAQTIPPAIVVPDDLERANEQMWAAEQITGQFIGPPLAGLLIASSVTLPFGIDIWAYALSVLLVWLIVLPPRNAPAVTRFLPALFEGFAWMRRNPVILWLAAMLGAINAVFIGGMTVLVLCAQEVLGLSTAGYGLLLGSGVCGGVGGGLLAPAIAARLGKRCSLLAALGTFVAITLMLGLFAEPVLAGLALFLEAAAWMPWNVVTVSCHQRLIPGIC